MPKIMHNIFLYCGQPKYFRYFSAVCWAEPTGRELPNMFPYLGVPEYLGQTKRHYIFGILQPLQVNHVRDNFRLHGGQAGVLYS